MHSELSCLIGGAVSLNSEVKPAPTESFG